MPLPEPRRDWALFLDFDGTLVEISDTPDAIAVDSGLPDVLRAIATALDGALAVVSGRQIDDIDHHLDCAVGPVAGLHGLERRDASGAVQRGRIPEAELNAARRKLRAFADSHQGILLEDKGASLALHYRMAPQHRDSCAALVESIAAASRGRLVVQSGKMVRELKPDGYHKGDAVAAYMAAEPFRGRRPVFAGDDVTDEMAFEVINRMDGISIRVDGAGPTRARYRAADVDAIYAWLKRFAAAGG